MGGPIPTWLHKQEGAVCMAAARLGYKKMGIVGTRWANSHYGCINRLRKHYSHLVGAHFWPGRLFGL